MIALIVTYDCKSNQREAFVNAIKSEGLDEMCRNEDGNIRYAYSYAAEDENRVYLLEQWESQEVLDIHIDTAHFKRIGELKEEYVLETKLEKYEY